MGNTEAVHEAKTPVAALANLTDEPTRTPAPSPSPPRTSAPFQASLIISLALITFLNSFGLGVTTIALPQVVADLSVPPGLVLWPGTANTLALACCLLPAGAVADVVGSRRVSLAGTLVLAAFTLAGGVTSGSTAFVVFRALAGAGAALVQATSVSIISHGIGKGRVQNVGFSCLGLSIPFGFAAGLILGGVFAATRVGWRLGFYVCGGLLGGLLLVNVVILPNDDRRTEALWRRVWTEIDWVGALIVALAFALLSYSFSLLTTDLRNIHKAPAVTTLCVGATLLPILVVWTLSRYAWGRVALLPRQIVANPEFILLCCIVFCAWAALNSMEWFFSIYFQVIQGLTPLQAAIRFLPNLVLGVILEIFIGAFIHKLPIVPVVAFACLLSTVSPLLMALNDPGLPYWRCIFWAMLLLPVAVDVLFTAAVLLITDIFPLNMHGIAGAVFNVVGQMGTAGGIAIMALTASGVSSHETGDSHSPSGQESADEIDYTRQGVTAVFWFCFGLSILTVLLVPIGLRKRTYVGRKETMDSASTDSSLSASV